MHFFLDFLCRFLICFLIVGRIGLCIYGIHWAVKSKASPKTFLGVLLLTCLLFDVLLLNVVANIICAGTDWVIGNVTGFFDKYF